MYKVQQFSNELGWVNATRAGQTLTEAKACLASYRRNWLADKFRLVSITEDGKEIPISDVD